MQLSELKEPNLSVDHATRILEVIDRVATEIDDPNVTMDDVVRMYCEDVAEIDRWEAAAWA